MKFLMTYAGSPDAPPPTPAKMAAIGAFGQKNAADGILLMSGGLVRPSRGIHLRCDEGAVTVTDGPFAETKELIDGFALIEVPTHADAVAVATEFMQIAGDGTAEILRVFDQGDGQSADR